MNKPTSKMKEDYIDVMTARIMVAVDSLFIWNLSTARYDEAHLKVRSIIAGEVVWNETGKE
jgi:hypothetical protein